jgi:heme-degrading monooxygenase HmoA
MHARVSTYTGAVERIDDAIRSSEGLGLTDAVRELDGFQGAYVLVDRASGRALTITLWSTEDAVQASAERANQMRDQAATSTGLAIASVDTYEVVLSVARR